MLVEVTSWSKPVPSGWGVFGGLCIRKNRPTKTQLRGFLEILGGFELKFVRCTIRQASSRRLGALGFGVAAGHEAPGGAQGRPAAVAPKQGTGARRAFRSCLSRCKLGRSISR